jgi:type VI secretion system protein ImpH
MATLTERLVDEFPTFNFFQAVLLLEEFYGRQGVPRPLESGRIRFASDSKLSFPPNDIADIQEQGGDFSFLLSFMGLIGASSPLPVYFSELPIRNPEAAKGLTDFLAIFNHRLYVLFFRAWKKYHFLRALSPRGDDPFSRAISALAGMPAGADGGRLRAFTGLLAGRSRGRAGLESLLSTWFDGAPVVVRQWMPRRCPIPDLPRLGNRCRLGDNAIAGTTVLDRAGSFRIVVGPLPIDRYESFLPGTENMTALIGLARGYCVDLLEFDVEVQLQSVDLIPVVLGGTDARLGATSSLGKSDQRAGVQSVVVEPGSSGFRF